VRDDLEVAGGQQVHWQDYQQQEQQQQQLANLTGLLPSQV
jgi:hypothetical protein